MQERPAQANDMGGSGGAISSQGAPALLQTTKMQEQRIGELEDCHNEQVTMINHFKQLSEEKTKFSLEVVNKSMLAVDLIRKYKEDAKHIADKSRPPHKTEVDDVEAKIISCQEAIQKDLIPTDPSSMVSNPLALQYLKSGSQQVTNSSLSIGKPNLPFQHDSHNYENQASNILEMEKRYETPLKQHPISRNVVVSGVSSGQQQHGGHDQPNTTSQVV